MKLRRLTPEGIAKFTEYLDLLENEPTRMVPTSLLEDSAYSEIFGKPTEIEKKSFGNRYAAAEYLDEVLIETGVANVGHDVGVGAWLSLFFFDELCPTNKSGEREPRERPAYIPEPQNYKRYYRHLLFGSLLIFRAHRDDPKRAMAFLCKPLPIIDDIVAQLASRQEIVSNPAVVELVTHLYYDPAIGTIIKGKGAGGKGGGSPRRLVDILRQFDVTWDLYAMSLKEFWAVLPKEFEKFRPTGLKVSS
jgi:hypothetical protein